MPMPPFSSSAIRTVVAALILLAAAAPVAAQVASLSSGALPRYYYCLLSVTELSKVDGVEQSFYVDTTFTCYYQEPGLTGLIPPMSIIPLPDALKTELLINNSYFEPQFMNKRGLEFDLDRRFVFAETPITMQGIALTNPAYPIATTPWIAVTQRFSGLFKADLELSDFPFDSQTLWVNISSSTPDFQGVFAGPQWIPPSVRVTAAVKDIIGWSIEGENIYNGTTFAADYGVSLPTMSVAIRLKRVPNYYVNKIVLGIVLITVMSQLTFLLSPRDSNRPMAAMSAFFGIVTYLFVISTDVPKIAYLTRMDRFVNLSFYFVFADFFLHLIVYVVVCSADEAEKKATEDAEDDAAERDARAADRAFFSDPFATDDDGIPMRDPPPAQATQETNEATVRNRGAGPSSTSTPTAAAVATETTASSTVRSVAPATKLSQHQNQSTTVTPTANPIAAAEAKKPAVSLDDDLSPAVIADGSSSSSNTANGTGEDDGHVAPPAGGKQQVPQPPSSKGAVYVDTTKDDARRQSSKTVSSGPQQPPRRASAPPRAAKGWWDDVRYYLRALDFIIMGALIVSYAVATMAILSGRGQN